MPLLTVVISTLGNHDGLRRVLESYEHQRDVAAAFEVVVVADAAEPVIEEVEAAARGRPYGARIVRGGRAGLSANRNRGLAEARTALVMFTDNDTLAEPDLVAQHLDWHERYPEPEVAVLGHVRWASEIDVTPFMRWLDRGIQFDYPNIQGIEAGWGRFYGANVSLKTEFARRVGGFDEERLPYGYEDLEYAYRADKMGLRVLYNRKAVVQHLRVMTPEFWLKRVRRVAVAERQFVRMCPEIEPYFLRMFTAAAAEPPARGRGIKLARWVPERIPLLGPRVWRSVDMYYRQLLAPEFLDAWDKAAADLGGAVQPDLSELEAESSVSPSSSGPK